MIFVTIRVVEPDHQQVIDDQTPKPWEVPWPKNPERVAIFYRGIEIKIEPLITGKRLIVEAAIDPDMD